VLTKLYLKNTFEISNKLNKIIFKST